MQVLSHFEAILRVGIPLHIAAIAYFEVSIFHLGVPEMLNQRINENHVDIFLASKESMKFLPTPRLTVGLRGNLLGSWNHGNYLHRAEGR